MVDEHLIDEFMDDEVETELQFERMSSKLFDIVRRNTMTQLRIDEILKTQLEKK